MDFEFSEIKMDSPVVLAKKDVAVSTRVDVAECGNVKKILGVSADGRMVAVNPDGGIAKCMGRINFKVLYLNENDELGGADYFANFTENIQYDGLYDRINGLITIIDTDVTIDNGIKLGAAINICLSSIDTKTFNALSATSEDTYSEKCDFEHVLIDCVDVNWLVLDELNVDADITRILFTDLTVYVDKAVAGMGNVLLNGTVNGSITYLANERVVNMPIHSVFSEEMNVESAVIGNIILTNPEIKNIKVTILKDGTNSVIKLNVDVASKTSICKNVKSEIIKDVFSVEKELDVTRDDIVSARYTESLFLKDEVAGIACIKEDMGQALEVLGIITGRNTLAKAMSLDGNILVEGVYSATILYRDENGLSSVDLEIPYSIPFDCNASKDDIVLCNPSVIKQQPKLKRAREIEVNVELGFNVSRSQEINGKYISDVKEGAPKEMNQSAVSVYIVDEGDTIYDVAKALSARPDDILKQNPGAENLKAQDKLFYFRGISFEF